MRALTRDELATCLGVDMKPDVPIDWNAIRPSRSGPRRISVAKIASVCAREGDMDVAELLGPRRAKHITLYRHAALYLAATHCHGHLSLPVIGRHMGRRDHTTVCHSRDKVKGDLLDGGEVFGELIAKLEHHLGVIPTASVDNVESGDCAD